MDLKDTVLQALNELVKNGGEGSGDFGHAGNPPHVGGSQPVEERKINKSSAIQKDKNKKSEEEKRQTDKEFSDRLTHEQIKEKVNKMKDEELVKEFLSAREKMRKEPVGKAGELSESEEIYGVIAQKLKEKTGRGFSQSSTKEEVEKALKINLKKELPSHAQLRTMPKEELIRKFLIDDGSIDKEDDMKFYKQLHQTELIDRIYKKHQKANNSIYKHEYIEY